METKMADGWEYDEYHISEKEQSEFFQVHILNAMQSSSTSRQAMRTKRDRPSGHPKHGTLKHGPFQFAYESHHDWLKNGDII
jgi:hypothetical protein